MWLINSFHIQIIIIELLFAAKAPKRRLFWLRLIPSAALYAVLPSLIPNSYFNEHLVIGWFTFGFLLMLLLSVGVLAVSFKLTLKQLIFYCCLGHTIQHIAHCISRIIVLALKLGLAPAHPVELGVFIIVVAGSYFLLRGQITSAETVELSRTHLLAFAVISMLTIYILSLWTTQVEPETIGEQLFDLITCVMLIIIMLDIFRFRKAEKNELIMLRLLRQEQEQHRMTKATVDVINRKCHDLKHQISALRSMSTEEQERSIEELEKAVMIYDSFAKTGNSDLDIILAEKSLLAEKEGITIRCIADGERLGFMRTEDLYALMGNTLDNAIEAAAEVDSAERIISLTIAPRGELLSIHLENPAAHEPTIIDGLPLTTKKDTDYHGYGVKSMRYIAEKYKGVLTTAYEDGVFSVDIILPVKGS